MLTKSRKWWSIFGCSHAWFSFKGERACFVFFNGVDIEFKISPMVCLNCHEVGWKYVGGSL